MRRKQEAPAVYLLNKIRENFVQSISHDQDSCSICSKFMLAVDPTSLLSVVELPIDQMHYMNFQSLPRFFGNTSKYTGANLMISSVQSCVDDVPCYYLPSIPGHLSGFKIRKNLAYGGIGLPDNTIIVTDLLTGCSIFSFETKEFVFFFHSNIQKVDRVDVQRSHELVTDIRAQQPQQYGFSTLRQYFPMFHDYFSSFKEFNRTRYLETYGMMAFTFWAVQKSWSLNTLKLYLYYVTMVGKDQIAVNYI